MPGMPLVRDVNADEYTAGMVTKASFITARMKLRTRIVERDAPRFPKAEGTGEDSGVASRSWRPRLFGPELARCILVDWQRPDGSRIRVRWPEHLADACLPWLGRLGKN